MQTRDGWTADELSEARRKAKSKAKNGNGFGLGLGAAATSWNTPRVSVGKYTRDRGAKGAERLTLEGQASTWQTPVADDMVDRAEGKWNSRGEPKLSGQAVTWPTPAAQNVKGSSLDSVTRADGKSRMDILHYRAEQGFTRPDLPTWDGGLTYLSHRQTSRRLLRSATSHLSPGKLRQWLKRGWWRKRRLNPLFVEWLMAWPSGHALCACSATAFTLWQQDMRGALSALPTASGPWIWLPPAQRTEPEQMGLW